MAERPPAHVGLGRPREPKPQAVAPSGPLQTFWAALASITGHGMTPGEIGDREKALRMHRLERLRNLQAPADIWKDIEAVLLEAFDAAVLGVMRKEIDPDALQATVTIMELFDKSLAQGRAALRRLAQRRLQASVAAHGAGEANTKETMG